MEEPDGITKREILIAEYKPFATRWLGRWITGLLFESRRWRGLSRRRLWVLSERAVYCYEPELNRLASNPSAGTYLTVIDRRNSHADTFAGTCPTVVAIALGWIYMESVSTSVLITAIDAILLVVFVWNYYRSELTMRNELREE